MQRDSEDSFGAVGNLHVDFFAFAVDLVVVHNECERRRCYLVPIADTDLTFHTYGSRECLQCQIGGYVLFVDADHVDYLLCDLLRFNLYRDLRLIE